LLPQGSPAAGRDLDGAPAADALLGGHQPARPGPPQRLRASVPAAHLARAPAAQGRRLPGGKATGEVVRPRLARPGYRADLRAGDADSVCRALRPGVPPLAGAQRRAARRSALRPAYADAHRGSRPAPARRHGHLRAAADRARRRALRRGPVPLAGDRRRRALPARGTPGGTGHRTARLAGRPGTGAVTRDRDPAGRPRNARPRDALGRPLDPAGGPGPGSGAAGTDRIPDDLVITGPEAAALADRLLRDGRPFHAHEVLEAAWKSGPSGERDLWQGLAQIAVGLTHARRGNALGAVALLSRGAERVRGYQAEAGSRDEASSDDGAGSEDGDGSPSGTGSQRAGGRLASPFGMNVDAFLAAADDLAARIERDGLDAIPPADLSPGLLAGAA